MNQQVAQLSPAEVWTWFEKLNAVPRPSKQEERVIAFVKSVGEALGLATIVDHAGNVIIKKGATAGREKVTPVILQAHLDMVHQKNADTKFDFLTQGIESRIDGDWVKAKGTTLGSDNGMGVASILAVLASNEIEHGPIEALFTIDEETGMTGAENLQQGLLDGKILLNTDTEDEGELTIGCAGGIDSAIELNCKPKPAAPTAGSNAFKLALTGLRGGHSGCEIHLGRGNANKLMNEILLACEAASVGVEIVSIDGGSLRNAIPRESFALLQVTDEAAFREIVGQESTRISTLYAEVEPELTIAIAAAPEVSEVLDADVQKQLLACIAAAPNGVIKMSENVEGLVETSTNLSLVKVNPQRISIEFLSRSSVESAKGEVAGEIEKAFAGLAAEVKHDGDYPGWEPNAQSPTLELMKQTYQEMFGKEANVSAVHAGLECGIIGNRYPGLDMVSFGPTIKNPHSPDEMCHIESVEKYWRFLVEVLQRIA